MSQFEKGDVVELKSGGPRMTVTMKALGGGWVCQWFDGEKPRVSNFPDEALQLVSNAGAQPAGDTQT